ncbi:NADPH:quinone reductase and related Zn-dependent oxidoreductase [Amycolatopsis mediterranei S699]|uniref:NADPH:quinone reductase and related Zn-dependent oxidoreductase n=2 Tax=Amycolatopsis mediterranei TaxID=33910 RepID=A0A0H3D198_AMYMU|nr:NADP-dependent oxidoreductase [Amycolatopsis mediterranei]ADJ43241.1 NADPH:quinone reductase and related Zn-dependent oxidoreductase [Amycolatopsis mediterranei U32]AEK39939.1 NADPH:quinone reductase and related Zn-dependent oxidoreductase [Amycolatopsis mediterranei S699]AFO74954.1 NADPH:quinone reductase and related Zn-dependent oxidoreductase [Amycolatopsis mediterranei S699]AGT82083.1 NADPH:quinone reductase-related Zn-dependent oxidoreductase [Amycolatopsis mediterranei RB]KDO05153.1 N
MKAAQIMSFGTPDVLRVTETETPTPGAGEVLVAVEASSVNGHDTMVRAGGLKLVLGRKVPMGTGLDFAGVVVEIGTGVAGFRAGDRVWGMVHPRRRHTTAAAAEYVVVAADRIGLAPAGVSAIEAASLVVTGSTALIALRESVGLAGGERVLVRGAAGGVGTAAVQLAHAMGGHVTALARGRHAAALRDLGADEVLDYGTTTAEEIGPFDVILDTVGSELNCYRSRLAKGGRMVTVGLSAPALAAIAASAIHGSRRIRTFSANPGSAVLDDTADYVTSGALRPIVHSVYPLADIAAAHQAFEHGGVLGKHVLAVSS